MMNNVTGVTLSSELINDMKKLLPAQGEADDGLEELQKFVGKEGTENIPRNNDRVVSIKSLH